MSLVDACFPDGFDFKNPDYVTLFDARLRYYQRLKQDGAFFLEQQAHYENSPVDWIEDFCITFDPRVAASKEKCAFMPFVLFNRQKDAVEWFKWLMDNADNEEIETDGILEKTRDCGMSWLAIAFSLWAWTYRPGAAIGFGSIKVESVDTLGNPKSLLEKARIIIRHLPSFMRPEGYREDKHANHRKIRNPKNNAIIHGEGGRNIGRGDRALIYFKDESAHYEAQEEIEASLSATANVKIDISSVNGTGNLFYNKRQSLPDKNVFIFDWRDDPRKNQAWYDRELAKFKAAGIEHVFHQEISRDYNASVEGVFIPHKWLMACVDYPLIPEGVKRVALDVADEEGQDTNALGHRTGCVLHDFREWNGVDTDFTANEAHLACLQFGADEFVYDRPGVGAGINGAIKKHKDDDGNLPYVLCGWQPGGEIYNGHEFYEYQWGATDVDITREEFADNAKAMEWWGFRRRAEKTYRNRFEGAKYPWEQCLCIRSGPLTNKLITELAQPKRFPGNKGKVRVESKKEMARRGIKSPNLADMAIMLMADCQFENEDLRLIGF